MQPNPAFLDRLATRRPSGARREPAQRDCAAPRCGGTPSAARLAPVRPHAAPASLCPACGDRLRAGLLRLLDAHKESDHALTPGPARLRERVSGSRAPRGIVLDERTVRLRSELTGTLASWARLVVDERGLPGPDRRDVGSLVRFLGRHLDWLAAHPAATDFDDEVTGLLESCEAAFGPGPAGRLPLGECLEPGCGGTLHAVVRTADRPDAAPRYVSCESGHVVPPHLWLPTAARLRHTARHRDAGPATPGEVAL